MISNPLVSIVVLNWNGKKWLTKCLPSLRNLTYKPTEIIVVNNGSTDDSHLYIKKNFPEIRIIELKKNVGFTKGNNIGVSYTRGEYILFISNDTYVTKNLLGYLVDDLRNSKDIGIVQPQIRLMADKKNLDSVGSFLTNTGFLYYYGCMKPYALGKYDEIIYPFSIKGACFMMRKKDYQKLGGLDEDFVCYVEETDLCHRIWLSGKKVMYEPRCYMYHFGGGDMHVMTKNELIIYRSYRNRIISYLKNLSLLELVKILPIHLAFCELIAVTTLLTGKFKQAFAIQLALLACLINLRKIMKKRSFIQKKIRKVSDQALNPIIKRNPRLSYYFFNISDKTELYRD